MTDQKFERLVAELRKVWNEGAAITDPHGAMRQFGFEHEEDLRRLTCRWYLLAEKAGVGEPELWSLYMREGMGAAHYRRTGALAGSSNPDL